MFRLLFCMLSFVFFPFFLEAQAGDQDTSGNHSRQKKGFTRLLPHHGKLQFAGGIGFLSAGIGYTSGGKRMQYDIYYGYVPESAGGVTIHSVTGKLTWIALRHKLDKNVQWDMLSAGILFNYAFGKQYFLFSPRNYPYHYYGFPTAAHAGFFAGGGLRYKKTGFYYEIGTTDKELLSYINNNRSLGLMDIINIGIGIRFDFR